MPDRVIIIGAGHAGGELALRLRRAGWRGEIVLIGEEPHPPYQRPPLSKKYLCGEWDIDRVLLRPRRVYADEGIELATGISVTQIDRDRQHVAACEHRSWRYDWLVLATGARARRPNIPGACLSGVAVLRSIEDVNAIKPRMQKGARLVVVGAGYVGLELAAVASSLGLDVLVCETQDRPLSRTTGQTIAQRLADQHRRQGVEFRFGVKVTAVLGDERAQGVSFADGGKASADLVVFGIGAVPETQLALRSGLLVDDGVVTDHNCRSSDPRIFAIGDCARRPLALGEDAIRLESVHNAVEGAKLVAAQITGAGGDARETPWFWSDQFDAKLQVAGLLGDHDLVVERHDGVGFAQFYLRNDVVVAVECLNHPAAFLAGRTLIGLACRVDVELIADVSRPMKEVLALAQQGRPQKL